MIIIEGETFPSKNLMEKAMLQELLDVDQIMQGNVKETENTKVSKQVNKTR